jgi:8-oxo-dGTP diphosphatase
MTGKQRPGYKKPAGYDPARYQRPSVACDIVIFTWRRPGLRVLLIQRKNLPYKGYWALPGGFIGIKEPLKRAAARELCEETGVKGVHLEEFAAFGDPDRDPRTRVISIAYLALVPPGRIKPRAGDDARAAKWFPVKKPPELAFDHQLILDRALQKLRESVLLSPSLFQLLPGEFELKELKALIQAVMNQEYPLPWFRDKILATGILKSAGPGTYRVIQSRFRAGALNFVFND